MKHGYKRAIAMLLAATVMTGLTACGGGSSSGGGSGSASGGSGDGTFTASGKTLNVGVQSNIISIPTVYAEEKGYFDDLGLDVNLIMFPNGSPENEGLAAEQLDVASNGLASVYSTASGLCDWIAESDSGSITAKVYVRSGSPVPVSYTHLDVYQRQACRRWRPSVRRIGSTGWFYGDCRALRRALRFSRRRSSARAHTTGCVVYWL